MIVRFLSGVYFTEIGLKEAVIGYLNFLGTPWNLKFVWAPFLDLFGTRRRWMLAVQFLLSALFGLLALLVSAGPEKYQRLSMLSRLEPPLLAPVPLDSGVLDWTTLALMPAPMGRTAADLLLGIVGLLVVLAFLAATNDIAIDAHYMEGLPDRGEQARLSGLRVTAYRLAVLFAKFGLIAFSTWSYGFACGALVMLALSLFHALAVPTFPSDKPRSGGGLGAIAKHLRATVATYLNQPRIWVIIPFITLYKLGDELLFAMNTTFLMRELHVTKTQLAWLSGAVGTVTSIVGSMAGGWWIKRVGLRRGIWPLTIAMNVNIWAYVWLAWALPDARQSLGITQIAVIHGYEQIAAGLGNAALTVFLLYTCKQEFKAAHYAFGSAIMSLTGTIFGGLSGAWVEQHGYVSLYILAFAGSLPSMLLLFFVPIPDDAGR